jgi:hypothetical protein
MRKILLLSSAAVLLCSSAFAKIWRINNTGAAADFTTAQAAHDNGSVVNGDTLHFEPSGTNYGALTMTKRLVIIGNGYLLGTAASNNNENMQANTASSVLTSLILNTGSDNSLIMGMSITNVYIGNSSFVSNIVIRRNYISVLNFVLCSNCQAVQNYCGTIDGYNYPSSATNYQINNNIISGTLYMGATDNGDIKNNIIGWSSGGLIATSSNIWNNILCTGAATLNTCDVRNNISSSTYFGTANGNQQNVVMTSVFEAAYPSGDIGAYGTQQGSPYVLSGIPNVPSIYKLTAPGTVTSGTLNVTISTHTNQ